MVSLGRKGPACPQVDTEWSNLFLASAFVTPCDSPYLLFPAPRFSMVVASFP